MKINKYCTRNNEVNYELKKQLDVITNEIKKIFKKKIVSIILAGSFGRGEGSVLIVNNSIKPINDFDILVELKKKATNNEKNKLKKLKKELERENKYISIDICPITYSEMILEVRNKSISNYELKKSTLVLFGKSKIKEKIINFGPEDIDLTSGTKLMINRAAGVLVAEKIIKNKQNIDSKLKLFIKYQIIKLILALGDSKLLINKKYSYKYSKKLKELKNIEKNKLFLNMYSDSFKFKMEPTLNFSRVDLEKEIKIVKKLFKKYFLQFEKKRLKKELNIKTWQKEFLNIRPGKFSFIYFLKNLIDYGPMNLEIKYYFIRKKTLLLSTLPSLFLDDPEIDYSLSSKILKSKKNLENLKDNYIRNWHGDLLEL